MPKPMSSVVRFVISTGGADSERTSTSGSAVRRSTDDEHGEQRDAGGDQTQRARVAPAPLVRPRDRRTAAARGPRRAAPRRGSRRDPGVRTGDSGTNSCAASAASAATIAPSQKIQW